MFRKLKINIRYKIFIPTMLLVLVPMVAFVFAGDWMQELVLADYFEDLTINKIAEFKRVENEECETALRTASVLAGLPEVLRAYEAHSDSIPESWVILENSMSRLRDKLEFDKKEVLLAHFHLNPAISFYRTWTDAKGDDLSKIRKSVTIVARTKKPVAGLEIGTKGLYIRGISPIFTNDKQTYYGSVEALVGLDRFLAKCKLNEKEDFAIFVSNKRLGQVSKELQRDNYAENIGEFSFLNYSSDAFRISDVQASELSDVYNATASYISYVKDNFYFVGFPLIDFTGNRIGVVVFQKDISDLNAQRKGITTIVISFLILVVCFIAVALFFVAKKVTDPLLFVVDQIKELSRGVLIPKLDENRSDEIGDLAKEVNSLRNRVLRLLRFSKEIGEGKFGAYFRILNPDDQLGRALVLMQDNLERMEKERKAREEADGLAQWLSVGRSKVSEILRENIGNIDSLSTELIRFIVNYLELNQGGLFISVDDTDPVLFRISAAYAFNREKYLVREFQIGENLVGMCAFEKETIYLTEIPDDYILIQSGVGGATPTVLLLIPLVFNGISMGVIELASFKKLESYIVPFLEGLAEVIASSLNTVKGNSRTNALLDLYKDQSERMISQEAETRQQLESMREVQRKASKSEQNLRNYIDIFDAAILRFLLNRNGEIIDVNVGFLELFGGVKDDFLRRNFLQFVSKNSREAISEKWTNFQRGEDEMYDLLFPCVVEYKEVWLSMRFVRFFDTIVNQEQFILIGVNVDSFKRAEIDASRKLKAISSSTLYATVLPSGELGAKRDFFTKGLGYDYEALNGKKTVDIIPADNELAIHWVRLYNGFPFSRVENHKTVFGHEKWFYISYIPILDEHDVLLEIILFASDVSENKLALVKEQTNVTALESELNRFQDIELEFSLLQARFKKQKKEFDFMREQTNLLIKQETVIFEKQKEDFKQEIGSLFAKINELELTKNIMKLNYEKQINNLSKIFEEDRKKMNRRILRLESEIETLLGQQRIVKN